MLRVTQLSGFGIGSGAITLGRVLAASGSYAVVGNTAGVQKFSPAAKTLAAAGGSYGLTGTAASLAGSFTPANLSGLLGWWDASVYASMTLVSGQVDVIASQVAGATGTTSLAAWNSGTRPVYDATGFNSRPTMLFDNRSIIQKYDTFPFGSSKTEFTIFAVCTLTSAAADYGRLISYNASGQSQDYNNDLSFYCVRSASTAALTLGRNSFAVGPTSFPYNTPTRVICTYTSAGVGTIYLNGVPTSSSGGATSAFGSTGSFFVGAGVNVLTTRWAGAVSELGVCNASVDATTAAALDTWLKNKWGL